MRRLIQDLFVAAFGDQVQTDADSALIHSKGQVLFTTDAYTVSPTFFPGGDLASLSVYGTVNDLAVAGAKPLAMSVAFVLEEGLEMEKLWRLACSMGEAAQSCGVPIVTGDTKVVERGKGDGLYVTTSAVGEPAFDPLPRPERVEVGDVVIVSGDLGRHGIAVLVHRAGIDLEPAPVSDAAPVHEPILALAEAGIRPKAMRDLTRGGFSAAANEIAVSAGAKVLIDQPPPIDPSIEGGLEILGLDPWGIACEGRFAAWLSPDEVEPALDILRNHHVSVGAKAVGRVVEGPTKVTVLSQIGVERVLDVPSGEQLPRIC